MSSLFCDNLVESGEWQAPFRFIVVPHSVLGMILVGKSHLKFLIGTSGKRAISLHSYGQPEFTAAQMGKDKGPVIGVENIEAAPGCNKLDRCMG